MVCDRCIETVQSIFQNEKLDIKHIELGKVVLNNELSSQQISKISKLLSARGFELLQDKKQKTVDEIKTEIIKIIHHNKDINDNINISEHISKLLGRDYSYLSNLFSVLEGTTIEKFIINQKIEKTKELLDYRELTLNEISFQLGYSSVQHLSNQFKKNTGLSPSQFRKIQEKRRKSLDKT